MNNYIQCVLKLIKAKEKNNISYSISRNEDKSFRSLNISGKLMHLNGYVTKDGINYDKELVEIGCCTTAIFHNAEQAEALIERAAEIFEERELEGDPNPAIDLILTVKTVRPKETNILLTNIHQAYLDSNTQIVDDSTTVNSVIAKLRANTEKERARPQVNAARAGLGNALQRSIKKITKTYL